MWQSSDLGCCITCSQPICSQHSSWYLYHYAVVLNLKRLQLSFTILFNIAKHCISCQVFIVLNSSIILSFFSLWLKFLQPPHISTPIPQRYLPIQTFYIYLQLMELRFQLLKVHESFRCPNFAQIQLLLLQKQSCFLLQSLEYQDDLILKHLE